MNRKMILAGAAGALLFGAAAIAQTSGSSSTSTGAMDNQSGASSGLNNQSTNAGAAGVDASSQSYGQADDASAYGSDTATTMAGERG